MTSQLPTPLRIAAKEAAREYNSTKFGSKIDFKAGVQWHHDYLLKDKPEFDDLAAIGAFDNSEKQQSELASFRFGARWQHQQSAAQIAALQSEVQRLESEIERLKQIELHHDSLIALIEAKDFLCKVAQSDADRWKSCAVKLAEGLRAQHRWQCETKFVGEPEIRYDLAGEYGDSNLYEQTTEALEHFDGMEK